MTEDALINAFAVAIAFAEGFYVNGSRPQRNHNPGDLTIDTSGMGVGHDGPFIVYANDNDGWDALKIQVRKILDNTSSVYNSNMTINEIAQRYTTTDQAAWAMNVASKLGVSPDTRISDLMTVAEVATVGVGIGTVILAIVAVYLLRKK